VSGLKLRARCPRGSSGAGAPGNTMSKWKERMTKFYKETDRFGAVDNEGERYIVVEQQRSKLFRRVKSHVLLSGEKVNHLKDGTFQIFDTGKILRKVG
jgi:hypothetical protein